MNIFEFASDINQKFLFGRDPGNNFFFFGFKDSQVQIDSNPKLGFFVFLGKGKTFVGAVENYIELIEGETLRFGVGKDDENAIFVAVPKDIAFPRKLKLPEDIPAELCGNDT